MSKYLTYDELMELALAHYNEGGDSTYECIDEKTFNEGYSKMTKEDALEIFARDLDIMNDRMGW